MDKKDEKSGDESSSAAFDQCEGADDTKSFPLRPSDDDMENLKHVEAAEPDEEQLQTTFHVSASEEDGDDDNDDTDDLSDEGTYCRGVYVRWKSLTKTVECTGTTTSGWMRSSISGKDTPMYSSNNVYRKPILNSVSGMAAPGQVLAILGPNGAGKTTLLNVLSGRTDHDSGTITIQGHEMSEKDFKLFQRMVAYVQQDDLFFDHLTVRDQLTYIALLRLPRAWTKREKLGHVESILTTLGLQECAGSAIRLISGGERKRVNIGTELLLNPSVIFCDEPCSSLDSANASQVMHLLQDLAKTQRKTVITTIHQPTSTLFQSFDQVMFLVQGSVVFFGTPTESIDYLSRVGYPCPRGFNVADFWLELLVLDQAPDGIVSRPSLAQKGSVPSLQRVVEGPSDVRDLRTEWVRDTSQKKTLTRRRSSMSFRGVHFWTPTPSRQSHNAPRTKLIELWDKQHAANIVDQQIQASLVLHEKRKDPLLVSKASHASWPTQFHVLLHRCLKNSKAAVFTPLNLVKSLCTGIVVGLLWFQMPYTEERVFDRESYLFFTLSYWVFEALFDALMSFPLEKAILYKERTSHLYDLSAYFLAKTVSEMPVRLGLPFAYMVVSYWMAGVNDKFYVFVGVTCIILLAVMAGESLGLLIGACVMDLDKGLAIMVVVAHALLVAGGFFVENVPSFMEWLKYLSVFKYSYDSSRILVFDEDVPCDGSGHLEFLCQGRDYGAATVDEVLDFVGVQGSFGFNLGLLFVTLLLPRFGAYIALRRQKTDLRYQ